MLSSLQVYSQSLSFLQCFGEAVRASFGQDEKDKKGNNAQVLLAAIKASSKTGNLSRVKNLHSEAAECGLDCNIYVANSLMSMYAKCRSMLHVHDMFDSIKHPTVVSWNVLILGYAEHGEGHTALNMFARMRAEGPAADSITLLAALKACTSLAVKEGWADCRNRAISIHNIAVENGCSSNVSVQNTLIDIYAKCGSMVSSRDIFDCMERSDVISWTALILGYAENGLGWIALDMFARMMIEGPYPNFVTFMAAIKACSSLAAASQCAECRDRVKVLHNFAVQNGCASNSYVQNSLIGTYSKCGDMVDAREVFDSMTHSDVVSWTELILGYAENGQGHTALHLFTMMRSKGTKPDSIIYTAVIKACSLVGALEFGRTLHSELEKGNNLDVVLVTALVDFYAKCGSLVEAQRVFDLHSDTRDMITWNALLAGYGSCGDNEAVFRVFEGMVDAGFLPNGVTFLCILTCCSHGGLVEKGKECFETMSTKYEIIPTLEHYTCMIDLLGRANKLDDAMTLLESMPCRPNDVTWTTILSACSKWKNVEIGRVAFRRRDN